MNRLLLILALGLLWLNCHTQTTVSYLASPHDFANPERGFYRYTETRSNSYSLLDQSDLEGFRLLHTPPSAGYSIYNTLVFRYFFLEDFITTSIPQSYLDNMQTDFNTARAAGVKLIPRFAYTDEVNATGCGSWICPPYGDAEKSWVLTHINQLAPLLQANKDVIATIQMGFIGVWGENYYTDYFGDASQGPDYKLTDANWQDRIDVLTALLDATPDERMVQVRYPQVKQRAVYGINAPASSAALSAIEAFMNTHKARIGFHNDCLLASPDDYGTYTDYGNSSSSSTSDTTNLKPYFANDGKFVVVGGETCDDAYSPQNDCAGSNPSAFGDMELARMHYSYLNAQYNNEVNNDWQTGGCLDDIKKRLGYRLELQDGTFSNSAQPGQTLSVDLNLKNLGFASPFNERGLELILRNTTSGEKWFALLPDDPRFWSAGNTIHNISHHLCIPAEMPAGTYEALLHLPDPMPALYGNPAYSIRLANLLPDNSEMWQPTTGYNQLGHLITIDQTSSNPNCNGEITFTASSSILPITLLSFSGSVSDGNILLNWTTTSEINNEGFLLERSENATSFDSIAWIPGAGNTPEQQDYSFVDTTALSGNTYYYRLAQKDFNGRINYSQIISVRNITSTSQDYLRNALKLYPNPTVAMVVVEFPASHITTTTVKLIDVYGKSTKTISIMDNRINLTAFPAGMYYLIFNLGGSQIVKKIVKL